MPGLVSFCFSGAVGLAAIYLLSISWFVACLYLDQVRIDQGRSALLPCFVLQDYQPPAWSTRSLTDDLFNKLADLQKTNVFKVAVLLVTSVLFGCGLWGLVSIRQELDYLLMLPKHSYLRKHLELFETEYFQNRQQIPESPFYLGNGNIYTGPLDYSQLRNMEKLMNDLRNSNRNGEYIGGKFQK